MATPQPGIFALGTASHAYLEFDATGDRRALVELVASLREPRTTIGGVNLVSGFRPSLWRSVAESPATAADFDAPLVGPDGYELPATQHDVLLWVAGSAYDVVFDVCRSAIYALRGLATIREETSSWPYHHDRDLTGFIDGTENPSVAEAVQAAVVPEGAPATGSSIVLLQKWRHDSDAWESLDTAAQEAAMGRTKPDSVELDPRPDSSHVARTDQEDFGKIFRRNMPYGTVTDHGTIFIGFSSDQTRLSKMLEHMLGLTDGVRDTITRYTRALTGAYYVVPSVEALTVFAPPVAD